MSLGLQSLTGQPVLPVNLCLLSMSGNMMTPSVQKHPAAQSLGSAEPKKTPERIARRLAFSSNLSQKIPQTARVGRMSQAAERLRLNLADALARDAHLFADFLERVGFAI